MRSTFILSLFLYVLAQCYASAAELGSDDYLNRGLKIVNRNRLAKPNGCIDHETIFHDVLLALADLSDLIGEDDSHPLMDVINASFNWAQTYTENCTCTAFDFESSTSPTWKYDLRELGKVIRIIDESAAITLPQGTNLANRGVWYERHMSRFPPPESTQNSAVNILCV